MARKLKKLFPFDDLQPNAKYRSTPEAGSCTIIWTPFGPPEWHGQELPIDLRVATDPGFNFTNPRDAKVRLFSPLSHVLLQPATAEATLLRIAGTDSLLCEGEHSAACRVNLAQ